MRTLLQRLAPLVALAALVAVGLVCRGPVPIDETRYTAVAWEMWLRGDVLVPHLNGAPYSHKPPLLFWLINALWAWLGVHDWVPRLVPALAAAASLLLTGTLARTLWPDDPGTRVRAPWLLLGSLYVALFATFLMFDLLMTACVLVGLIGLARAWRAWRGGWTLFALGIGFGVLTKGPAVLVYLLPAALAAPWWATAPRPLAWRRWYRALGLAVLAGAALALAWAIPAAVLGGEEYRHAILWGQTAGRMVKSFAHQRPWWWYLPVLPAILLPWALWPRFWQALLGRLRAGLGAGERFCLAWLLPGLLVFSAISGKQVHYLLPLLPAVALLIARGLGDLEPAGPLAARIGAWLLVLPYALLGVALALAPLLAVRQGWPAWVGEVSPLWGVLLAAVALAWPWLLARGDAVPRLPLLTVLCGVLVYAGPIRAAAPTLDGAPLAARIGERQQAGQPVAHPGKYHGEFQFAGRLAAPLVLIPSGGELDWARAHPDGALVLRHTRLSPEQRAAARYTQPYRQRHAVLWDARTLLEHPEFLAGEDAPVDAADDTE
ncbi:4-amino-4-deoxy-L-arabinose transferase-like glycosyltransferase [Plasticicumulans lactativorans]|uniref:4-amino-4-deoxy-L-arabinose transferase-like glycosyltransferase n=1 Tax=Plasticicumulans lactativorans TaxID=1133106 RepID=A0A4R2LEF5_9GAMM|nr:glycosyltransferase family 39 protein [Plasticicumulans lactativorans]TCO83046.1 4-amino-4-deoxy-L-arabinose transferase-like glycosyltransferase [Plasticicumulans lactativorans]